MKNLWKIIGLGLTKLFLNSDKPKSGYYINAIDALSLSENELIKVVPVGYFPEHPDGAHEITAEHIKEMADNINAGGTDILFDFGHDSLWNMGAKAAGWSDKNSAIAKEDGLYIKYPAFTAGAKQALEQREYRYFSPVYALNAKDKSGKEIGAKLHSVGLTNTPYMDTEIDHAKNAQLFQQKKEDTMNPKLLAFIGLAANATETDIEAKLNSLRTTHGLNADAGLEAVIAAVKKNSEAAQEKKEDADKAKTEVDKDPLAEVNKRLEKMEQDKQAEKVETLVNSAISEGKILPAEKDVYMNSARADFPKTKELLDKRAKNSALPDKVKTPENPDTQTKKNSRQECADFLRTQIKK